MKTIGRFLWRSIFLFICLFLMGCDEIHDVIDACDDITDIKCCVAGYEQYPAFFLESIYVSGDDQAYQSGDEIPVKRGDHLFVNIKTNPPLTSVNKNRQCTNTNNVLQGVPIGLYFGKDVYDTFPLKIVNPGYNPLDPKFHRFDNLTLKYLGADYLYKVCLDAFTLEWPIDDPFFPEEGSPVNLTFSVGLTSSKSNDLNPYPSCYRTYATAKITLVSKDSSPKLTSTSTKTTAKPAEQTQYASATSPSLRTPTNKPTLAPTKPPATPTINVNATPSAGGNCSWVNTIVGSWVSKNNDVTQYMRDGTGVYNGTTPFRWTCLENGQFKNLTQGSVYTLQFPDANHYIMNNDTWTRMTGATATSSAVSTPRSTGNCSWVNTLIGSWVSKNYDVMIFQRDGLAFFNSTKQFRWTCLDNGQFKNLTEGSVYTIQFPDADHFIMNNDTWTRIRIQ